MNALIKLAGYLLVAVAGTMFFYVYNGILVTFSGRGGEIWQYGSSGAMLLLAIWLTTGRLAMDLYPETASRLWGILSLAVGVAGVFWWPEVLALPAVGLAVWQLRLRYGIIPLTGLFLGIADYLLAVFLSGQGLWSTFF